MFAEDPDLILISSSDKDLAKLAEPDRQEEFPFRLSMRYGATGFMDAHFAMKYGDSIEILVGGKTYGALQHHVNVMALRATPNLIELKITDPDGDVLEEFNP